MQYSHQKRSGIRFIDIIILYVSEIPAIKCVQLFGRIRPYSELPILGRRIT